MIYILLIFNLTDLVNVRVFVSCDELVVVWTYVQMEIDDKF